MFLKIKDMSLNHIKVACPSYFKERLQTKMKVKKSFIEDINKWLENQGIKNYRIILSKDDCGHVYRFQRKLISGDYTTLVSSSEIKECIQTMINVTGLDYEACVV